MKCDCNERVGIEINSHKLFLELKTFFEEQELCNRFVSVPVAKPYYVGRSSLTNGEILYFADKWYICNCCGTLWEFKYPDFPSRGFIRRHRNKEK